MLGFHSRWAHAACALLSAGLAACSNNERGPDVAMHFGRIPKALNGPCSGDAASVEDILDQLDSMRVRVSGPGMKSRESTSSPGQDLEVDKIPEGKDRKVLVHGLRGSRALWRGQAKGVNVKAGETSEVSVLLTQIAGLTCSRSNLATPRSFHTATPLNDGRILIVGGITSEEHTDACSPANTNCKLLTATETAEIFDPQTGTFSPTGSMVYPRAFHTAVALPDGRVVVVGGAGRAVLNNLAPFPLLPQQAAFTIEVYDPASGKFSDLGWDPGEGEGSPVGRTFAAGIRLHNGAVLFSGGSKLSLYSAEDGKMQALRSSVLCRPVSNKVKCEKGPDMAMRRVGHVMVELLENSVLVYGGSIESGEVAPEVYRQAPETYVPGTTAEEPGVFAFETEPSRYIGGTSRINNLFFSSVMRTPDLDVGVFLVGGLTRADDSDVLNFEGPHSGVWFVYEPERFMSQGPPGVTWTVKYPRYFAQVAPVGEHGRWIIAGGFSGPVSEFQPSKALEFWQPSDYAFGVITVGGEDLTMREPRGGMTMSAMPSGTVVMVGGHTAATTPDGGFGSPLDTAEIFTDTEPNQ